MSFTKIDHYEKEYVDHHHDSALSVTEGVADQPIVNPYFVRKKKHRLSTEEYVKGILEGNITTLSQAITLIESSNPDHYAQAQEIIERCLPHAGRSVRIGITGVPGAGKSTFIEAIGNMVTSLRHKLAVLAIDPSSERSGGSILGDKTRMESISANPDVFIRPSPSAGSLGGVARKTRETIVLCEAAGFDVIFIETVGVAVGNGRAFDGRSVHAVADFGRRRRVAGHQARDHGDGRPHGDYQSRRREYPQRPSWRRRSFRVRCNSSRFPSRSGVPGSIPVRPFRARDSKRCGRVSRSFWTIRRATVFFRHNRNRQNKYWMYETIDETLKNSFYRDPRIEAEISVLEGQVLDDKISSFIAAKRLLDLYFGGKAE